MQLFRFATTALAGAAGLAFAIPALAQPADNTADWNGVYVGANAGWNGTSASDQPGFATVHSALTTVPTDTFPTKQMDFSTSNYAAGGQVGFNKQIGHYVFGLEGDLDSVGGRTQQSSNYLLTRAPTPGGDVGISRVIEPDFTSTIRARAGYAVGPVLFYGTGGLAMAQTKQGDLYSYSGATTGTPTIAGPFANAAVHDVFMTGWTAGGGVEYAINRHISVGAEYRHSDYGTAPSFIGRGAPGAVSENNAVGYASDEALFKVNYKFGVGMF